MPGLVETHAGDLKSLALLVEAWNQFQPLICHLFTNDIDPDADTVVADLVELALPGYSPRPVKYWDPPLTEHRVAYTSADPILFATSPGALSETVYGYWMEDSTDPGVIWWAERFTEPVLFDASNPSFVFFPLFQLGTPLPTP